MIRLHVHSSLTIALAALYDSYQGASSDVPIKPPRRTRALAPLLMAIPHRHADPHIITEDRTFFVTSSIAGKRNLLQSCRSAQLFVDVLSHYRSQHKYRLHGFVGMPDHFHVLITVGREMSVERAVQLIKGGYAFRAERELEFRPPVWERGFSEMRIYDAENLSRVSEYIAQNPVKRKAGRDSNGVCLFFVTRRIRDRRSSTGAKARKIFCPWPARLKTCPDTSRFCDG